MDIHILSSDFYLGLCCGKDLDTFILLEEKFPGRFVLIQLVLSGISVYFLSLFRILVKVCNNLKTLMCHFLWDGVEEGKGLHWISWRL